MKGELTKYQRELLNEEKRAQHTANILILKGKLKEARMCLAVMGNDPGYESVMERNVVKAEIGKLANFLDDEMAAYKATFEDEGKANAAVSTMFGEPPA